MQKEIKILKCPICDEADIKVIYKPPMKKENLTTTVGGNKFKGSSKSKEKWIAKEDCPNCGASKSKIERALKKGGDYKKPSRKRILERMLESGLISEEKYKEQMEKLKKK